MNIRDVNNFETMLCYFGEKLGWNIDTEDFDPYDYTYEVFADELGIKEEEISQTAICQLRPLTDNMPFGIFVVSFESKKLQRASLRKILSGLVRKKRDEHLPVWDMHDLIFLCFWGEKSDRYIGVACYDDNDKNLPQLKIEYIQPAKENDDQIDKFETKLSHLKMPVDVSDTDIWREEWKKAFTTVYHQQIDESKELAEKLADLAKSTRDTIIRTYNVETDKGYVHDKYRKFRDNLVHDLTVEQFADMYAQTIAYGLFSAKCMDNSEHFEWREAVEKIPNTNPFLKKLIQSSFQNESGDKYFFDEMELEEIINLLNHTNIKAILDYWDRQTGGGKEDTVIYFYEDFLDKYEHETKKRRGVYYTPQPVVKFMVRAVDDILKKEFGFEDGLAQNKERKKTKYESGIQHEPAVNILDPATGTGTFLREVIVNIHNTFKAKHIGKSEQEVKRLWNEYVPKYLLPRINGFELMMAPYAVAHMKLAMVLKETGYEFESDQRLNVLLTNSLEPSASKASFMETEGQQLSMFEDPLAAEAYDADKTKNNQGINVIIGNPPYNGESSNKGEWIMSLMEDYKKEPGGKEKLKERNPKWINDDYVKFIRYAQTFIEKSNAGIIALITPNKYMENSTFRGMRWLLSTLYDRIYIVNLHGNSKEAEKNDENVFDIQQGVAISILIRTNKHGTTNTKIKYIDVSGTREEKYDWLDTNSINSITDNVISESPNFFFMPIISTKSKPLKQQYENGFLTNELFIVQSAGIVTARDNLTLHDTFDEAITVTEDFATLSVDEARNKYKLGNDVRDWKVSWAQEDVNRSRIDGKLNVDLFKKISYRVFDERWLYYTGNSRGFACYPRYETMRHMLYDNIAFISVRKQSQNKPVSYYFVSANPISNGYIRTDTVTIDNLSPLFLYKQDFGKIVREPNLKGDIVKAISCSLELPFESNSDGGRTDSFAPIDLLDYIYAVLHSPKYRETYKEFLKIDFPRVPYPTDKEMFWKMVKLGGEIRKLHLMESPLLDTLITRFPLNGSNEVEKITRKENRVYINKTQYFDGISDLAWNFYIGGYQPLQKWLKDRKGRTLSDEDIIHYQKIAVALTETDRLMKEIDEVFIFGEDIENVKV